MPSSWENKKGDEEHPGHGQVPTPSRCCWGWGSKIENVVSGLHVAVCTDKRLFLLFPEAGGRLKTKAGRLLSSRVDTVYMPCQPSHSLA